MPEQDIPALLERAAGRTFPADYPQRPSTIHGQQLYDEAAALRALAAGWQVREAERALGKAVVPWLYWVSGLTDQQRVLSPRRFLLCVRVIVPGAWEECGTCAACVVNIVYRDYCAVLDPKERSARDLLPRDDT